MTDRLVSQHEMLKQYDKGEVNLTPYVPQAGDKILDIGTGTGALLQ
jgi:ubiquinone/menaquinone biosynthesis C-methylase UbiE